MLTKISILSNTSMHIQVDIRGEQLGKRTPIELGVVGDVKMTNHYCGAGKRI